MAALLKRDICHIGDHSKLNDEIEDLNERKAKFIPGDLQYACQYWALHLHESSSVESLLASVKSFAFKFILYWMEVLSITGNLGGGLKSLRLIQEKFHVCSAFGLFRAPDN
jgi:hypothetical protein